MEGRCVPTHVIWICLGVTMLNPVLRLSSQPRVELEVAQGSDELMVTIAGRIAPTRHVVPLVVAECVDQLYANYTGIQIQLGRP